MRSKETQVTGLLKRRERDAMASTFDVGLEPGLVAPDAPSSVHSVGAAPVVAAAASPAGLTAQKESAPVSQATQSREQNQHHDFATEASADKAFQTLRAELALRSYGLSRTHGEDGPVSFHVSRWGMVRELRYLAAVRAFAAQVGVRNA